ncbi:unnamed protein product [Discosporangium mesarthrocarpum]
MEKTDFKTHQKKQMGEILVGIQIWPVEKAKLMPVGPGRSEPNNSPYLPPPTGRISFSWNPFILASELLGPKLYCRCLCLLAIILVIIVLMSTGPILSAIASLATWIQASSA